MFRYRLYGLAIASDSELPELSPRQAEPDEHAAVLVRLQPHHRSVPRARPPRNWVVRSTLPDGRAWLESARVSQGFLLRYPGFAEFFVDAAGAEIDCLRRARNVSEATIRHILLDQVFPLALNLRGREAIHATAVQAHDAAIAFTGPAGAGKSTLAAFFARHGHPSLGDDCIALEDRGTILAHPAYPGLRLFEDVARALDLSADDAGGVAQYTAKRRIAPADFWPDFPEHPLPLKRIYRLVRDDRDVGDTRVPDGPAVVDLSPRDALLDVVSATFPLDTSDREMLARHFRFMTRVASEVPVKRLRVPSDLAMLPAVREAILADLAN